MPTTSSLWYYYGRSGRELDAIFRLRMGFRGIEVKYRAGVDERDIRKVAPVRDYILLSRDEVDGGKDLLVAPVDIFLSLLPVSEGNI